MSGLGGKSSVTLTEWCKICLYDLICGWTPKSVWAIIILGLCSSLILGLPFLLHNHIVIDAELRTVIQKNYNIDLLHPMAPKPSCVHKTRKQLAKEVKTSWWKVNKELKSMFMEFPHFSGWEERVKPVNVVTAVRKQTKVLAAQEELVKWGANVVKDFKDVFDMVPHLDELPSDIFYRIKLKDSEKTITMYSYSSSSKYSNAWETLIQQHLDAGCIHPLNSAHTSPVFLILKFDPQALPWWVNNYHMLNSNTLMDSHPLPRIKDILADYGKGRIWSKMDMTNSFF